MSVGGQDVPLVSYPGGLGYRDLPSPSPILAVLVALLKAWQVPAFSRRTCWRLGVVLVFWEQQPPLPLVGSQPPLALDGEQDSDLARETHHSLPGLCPCPSLAAFWQVVCTVWGDTRNIWFLDAFPSIWVVGALPRHVCCRLTDLVASEF